MIFYNYSTYKGLNNTDIPVMESSHLIQTIRSGHPHARAGVSANSVLSIV